MTFRDYRTMDKVWEKIKRGRQTYNSIPLENIYKEKMDMTYLNICYYNLKEKYLCGGINEEDWNKLNSKYWELIH